MYISASSYPRQLDVGLKYRSMQRACVRVSHSQLPLRLSQGCPSQVDEWGAEPAKHRTRAPSLVCSHFLNGVATAEPVPSLDYLLAGSGPMIRWPDLAPKRINATQANEAGPACSSKSQLTIVVEQATPAHSNHVQAASVCIGFMALGSLRSWALSVSAQRVRVGCSKRCLHAGAPRARGVRAIGTAARSTPPLLIHSIPSLTHNFTR